MKSPITDASRSIVFRKLSHVALSYGLPGLLMLGNISVNAEFLHVFPATYCSVGRKGNQ
jgi:hypothetical protein